MRFSNEAPRPGIQVPNPQRITPAEDPPLRGLLHKPTKPTVVTGACGVIVDYANGVGHIVVKHPTSPSLAATVKNYLTPKQDSHSWIVRFDWKAIVESDRESLEELHAASRCSGGPNTAATLADVMRGMTVCCELQKTHAWEVKSMRIAFSGQKFNVPPTRRSASHK